MHLDIDHRGDLRLDVDHLVDQVDPGFARVPARETVRQDCGAIGTEPFAAGLAEADGGAVRMVGDINDPDFYGSLRGTNLKAFVNFLPDDDTLSPFAGEFFFHLVNSSSYKYNQIAGVLSIIISKKERELIPDFLYHSFCIFIVGFKSGHLKIMY